MNIQVLTELVDYFSLVPLGRVIAGEIVGVDLLATDRDAFDFFVSVDDFGDFVVMGGMMHGKNELLGVHLFALDIGPTIGQGHDVEQVLDLLTQHPRFSQWRSNSQSTQMKVRELENIPFYIDLNEARRWLRTSDF